MQRIAIIGCGGAGKSTLARQLGQLLALPVVHLDAMYWKPGWVESSQEEFVRAQAAVLAQPRWIIDGNYGQTLELRLNAADTIIVMDLPTHACLWGAIKRYLKYRGRTRPDMSDGNPEKIDGEYLAWIFSFRRRRRPKILEQISRVRPDQKAFVLQSRAEVARFVRELNHARLNGAPTASSA